MDDIIVKMQGVHKSFPGVRALDDVNFELNLEKLWPCWAKTVLAKVLL